MPSCRLLVKAEFETSGLSRVTFNWILFWRLSLNLSWAPSTPKIAGIDTDLVQIHIGSNQTPLSCPKLHVFALPSHLGSGSIYETQSQFMRSTALYISKWPKPYSNAACYDNFFLAVVDPCVSSTSNLINLSLSLFHTTAWLVAFPVSIS